MSRERGNFEQPTSEEDQLMSRRTFGRIAALSTLVTVAVSKKGFEGFGFGENSNHPNKAPESPATPIAPHQGFPGEDDSSIDAVPYESGN